MATTPSEGQNLRETTDGPNWWRYTGTVLQPSHKQTHIIRWRVGGRREAAYDPKRTAAIYYSYRDVILRFRIRIRVRLLWKPHWSPRLFTFDPGNKLLIVGPETVQPDGTLVIEAVLNVYNEAREWEASFQGITFDEVVTGTGGVVLPSGIRTEVHVILNDDWRIQPPDNAQSIQVVGNLHRHDDTDSFAPSPSGNTPPVSERKRQGRKIRISLHYLAIVCLIIGLVLLAWWAIRKPSEIEPYATFVVVAATLVQLIRNGKPI